MIYIFPLLVIALSLGGLSYILIRKVKSLPGADVSRVVNVEAISNQAEVRNRDKSDIFGYNILGRIFERIGEGDTVFVFMEKFFRRARIRLMKIENFLTEVADRLHKRNIQRKIGQEGGDFDDAAEKNGKNNRKISLSSMGADDFGFDEQYWLDILKHDPGSAYPYKKLSNIYLAREDFSTARSMLRYALRLEPEDAEIKQMIEDLRGKRTTRKKTT